MREPPRPAATGDQHHGGRGGDQSHAGFLLADGALFAHHDGGVVVDTGGGRRALSGMGGFQGVEEFPRRLEAVARLLGHGLADHPVKGAGNLDVELGGFGGVLVQGLVHDGRDRARERLFAGKKLVQDHAGGIEVGTVVDRLPHELFRRHVAGRAHDRAHLGHGGGLDPRDAEVHDFQLGDVAIRQQDVGGFEIAMDDAVVVGEFQGGEEGAHDTHDVVLGKPDLLVEQVLEFLAPDELHGNVGGAVFLAVVVDGDDAGMGDPARRLGLALEARQDAFHLLGVEQRGLDGLDRDRAFDLRIESLEYDTHGALTKYRLDLIFPQFFGWTIGHRPDLQLCAKGCRITIQQSMK